MHSLINDFAAGLLNAHEPPCLSLYQPTHRRPPDNLQDPIRFRNLVKAIEQSLRQKYAAREIKPLLEPFRALVDDRDFWNHTLEGLALLAAPVDRAVLEHHSKPSGLPLILEALLILDSIVWNVWQNHSKKFSPAKAPRKNILPFLRTWRALRLCASHLFSDSASRYSTNNFK